MQNLCRLALFAVLYTTTSSARGIEIFSAKERTSSIQDFEGFELSTPSARTTGRKLLGDGEEKSRGSVHVHRQRRPYRHGLRGRLAAHGRRHRGPRSSRPIRRRPGSSSLTEMVGVLRVIVYGNGESCFVKIWQRGMTYRQQFGDSTTTSAFIDLFGRGECEPGARGIAFGYVRASVIARAHAMGDRCETEVISEVVTRTRDLDPNDGVDVIVGGAAGGEALAVCGEAAR